MNVVSKLTPLICLICILVLASQPRASEETTLDQDSRLGQQQASRGEWDDAIDTFDGILEEDPHATEAWQGMAEVYLHQGNSDLAIVASVRYLTLIKPDDDSAGPVAEILWKILTDQMDQEDKPSNPTRPGSSDQDWADQNSTDAGRDAGIMRAGQMVTGNAPPMPLSSDLNVTHSGSTSPSPKRLLRQALEEIPDTLESIGGEAASCFSRVAPFFKTALDHHPKAMLNEILDILRAQGVVSGATSWTKNHGRKLQKYREWAQDWQPEEPLSP